MLDATPSRFPGAGGQAGVHDNEHNPLLEGNAAFPGPGTLTKFAHTRVGLWLGSHMIKMVAGAIAGMGFALLALCPPVGIALLVTGGALWLLSTILSTARLENKSPGQIVRHLLVAAFLGVSGGMVGAVSISMVLGVALFDSLTTAGILVTGGMELLASLRADIRSGIFRARASHSNAVFTEDRSYTHDIHKKLLKLHKQDHGFDHAAEYNGVSIQLHMNPDGCPVRRQTPSDEKTHWVAVKRADEIYDLYRQEVIIQTCLNASATGRTPKHPGFPSIELTPDMFITGEALNNLLRQED